MTPFTFQRDGLVFSGIACGQGPPLILLHGGGSRASTFAELMPMIGGSYRVYAYDQRGFGGTSASASDEISHRAWADDLGACLDHIGSDRAVVCGWSLGAAVALNFASQHSDRVAALVLLGAPRPDHKVDRRNFERRLAMIALGATAAEVVAATFDAVERGFSPWTPAHRPRAIERIRAEHLAQDVGLAARLVDAYCDREDLVAVLPQILCPVHLIVGADDPMCGVDAARVLASHLSQATLTVIPDCGHYYAVEQPALVVQAMLAGLVGSALSGIHPGPR